MLGGPRQIGVQGRVAQLALLGRREVDRMVELRPRQPQPAEISGQGEHAGRRYLEGRPPVLKGQPHQPADAPEPRRGLRKRGEVVLHDGAPARRGGRSVPARSREAAQELAGCPEQGRVVRKRGRLEQGEGRGRHGDRELGLRHLPEEEGAPAHGATPHVGGETAVPRARVGPGHVEVHGSVGLAGGADGLELPVAGRVPVAADVVEGVVGPHLGGPYAQRAGAVARDAEGGGASDDDPVGHGVLLSVAENALRDINDATWIRNA